MPNTTPSPTKITIDKSGNQVVHSPVGATPLPSSAGQAVTITSRGNQNEAHGQVSGTSVVFDNPGRN